MPTNLSSLLLAAAMMLAAVPSAFAQVTTFNVDMSCAPGFDNVFVTGPWCSWCANEEYNTLTDPDGDGIYSVTLDEMVTGPIGTIEYRYAINGFTDLENLVNDMIDGASCAPITDYNAYANRQTPQGSTTNDYYGTCDGTCNDTPPVNVTFHVDMSGYQGLEDPSQVTWNSSANGWCGNCAPMDDLDGDGIYSLTVPLEGESIEYKFGIGPWYDEEDLEPESSCTVTTYSDGAPNGCCYVNRVVSVLGEEPIDLPVVCWNECQACIDSLPTSVTFRVDMSNEEISPFGVHVAGDFQGWDPATTEMTDPDGDMIYEYTHTFEPEVNSIEYKFINGNTWTDYVELLEGECANVSGNRILDLVNESDIVLSANEVGDAYCFNQCGACVMNSTGDVIWSNDISNCADWTFGNASDEVGAPWYNITIDFECSTVGPAGPYNGWAGGAADGTPAPAINSTTASNGFLMIDSDEWGADVGYDAAWVENSWVQTSTPIDCSVNPLVAISFETRYRCWDNGGSDGSEKCFVEISRDGTTWPVLSQSYAVTWEEEGMVAYGSDMVQCRYEVFPESETGFETENPDYREFDITEAAGGQSEVWIRFRWVGIWGYSWEIDDIKVFDIEENDTRIDSYLSYTNYQQTGIYENGAWAQSQLPESLSAGAKVYNFGWGTQENVVLDIEVNGATSSSSIIETFPNAASDTLSADYVVSEVGTYTVNYALTADNVDDNPQNNYASQSFEVTEFSYGRDNGVIFDTYGGDFEYACMPYYDIHNDATIYGIDVAIMNGGESGSPIRAFVIDLDDPANLGADGFLAPPYDMLPLAESGETYLNPGVANSGTGEILWYTFEFEEPLQVTAGQVLGASFEYFGGAALSIAESSTNFDGTAVIYGPSAFDGSYAWRGTDEMPMVRLNLDPNIEPTVPGGIAGCTDPQACNFDPTLGAIVDDFSCLYLDALGVCGGNCSLDSNGDGVCDLLGCDALFFSEYVEGFGNNKALEIYNPTPQIVDLSDYQIERYVNGATAAADNQKVTLSGLLAPQDVVVCVLDKQDPDGVDFEAPVWDELAARADLWLNPVYEENNAMYYKGNDALVLRQTSSNAVLDVIGRVGEDPGSEGWAGLTNNHTLIRKFEVTSGDFNAVDDFLVLDEWVAIAWSDENISSNAIFDNLGVHDGICSASTNPGCTDPSAFNFDPTAEVDDGSCIYFETSCAAIGAPEWEAFDVGLYAPTALSHTAGQSVTQEVVLHVPASIEEAGSGTTYAVAEWSGLEVMGMPAGLAFDNLAGTISGGSQTCLTYSGVPNVAGTYEVTLTGELFLSVFGNPVSAGDYAASLVITIEANGNAVFGCTYPHALNFNPAANDDDGSCEFAGCTDPSAENFEPYASVDDGTCETEPCVASCLGDLNNDGIIGSADLLTLLTTFGGDCE